MHGTRGLSPDDRPPTPQAGPRVGYVSTKTDAGKLHDGSLTKAALGFSKQLLRVPWSCWKSLLFGIELQESSKQKPPALFLKFLVLERLVRGWLVTQ